MGLFCGDQEQGFVEGEGCGETGEANGTVAGLSFIEDSSY